MTFRSRAYLDLAHTAPCQAQFKHDCAQHNGCDPAHSDSLIFGRGYSHKSPDWAVAHMCHTAHMALDTLPRGMKRVEWLRAYVATQNWLWNEGKLKIA